MTQIIWTVDDDDGTADPATNTWTCMYCGQVVSYNSIHSCQYKESPELHRKMDRIIELLERLVGIRG